MTAPNPEGFIVGATGHVYTAPVGTAAPAATNTALSAPATPWGEIGYIGSGEQGGSNLPEWGSSGGDKTVLGAWGKHALRTITSAITETVRLNLSEFSRQTLKYYTGADGGTATGLFDVNGDEIGQGTEVALLVVIHDGDIRVGFHAARASLSRADSFTVANDDATIFPVDATLLDPTTGPRYTFISEDLLVLP